MTRVALERLELALTGHSFVPMPSSVNSSSSSECGWRPSRMCACPTPDSSACTAASSLGRMPPVTSREPLAHLLRGGLGDAAGGIVGIRAPALHVGEEDELECAQRRGHRRRGGVGVHVVRAALGVGAHRGDHRDVVLGDVEQHVHVHGLDVAHEADVGLAAGEPLAHREQAAVVAAEAHRRLPVAVDAAARCPCSACRRAPSSPPRRWPRRTRAGPPRSAPPCPAAPCSP